MPKFAEISRDPQFPCPGLSQCCTVMTEQYVHLWMDLPNVRFRVTLGEKA
jgi:hypothetical protein